MHNENLATYLFDHFAGSEAALEMMENLEKVYPDSQVATVVARIRPELEYERDVLRKILDAMQAKPSTTRRVAGWLSEKVVEFKLRVDDPSSAALRLLESVEMLSIGISGKIALWKALDGAKSAEPVLLDVDYQRLLEMANTQHALVESVRMNAAREAFGAATTVK